MVSFPSFCDTTDLQLGRKLPHFTFQDSLLESCLLVLLLPFQIFAFEVLFHTHTQEKEVVGDNHQSPI